VAGLALTPQALARAGVGGGVDLGEGDLDHLLSSAISASSSMIDIPAHVILAVAIHVIKAFAGPSAQKQTNSAPHSDPKALVMVIVSNMALPLVVDFAAI
jgi:hypothetical protein